MKAPDFPAELEWLNTERRLSLRDLRGKAVLLDFWTYCCIDCMHIIPELKSLEEKYAEALVVIGVHSGKFTTERQTANIRKAIARYEITHPVVNDREMVVWRMYGSHAWPTLILIDPEGEIVHSVSEWLIYHHLDSLIAETIEKFDKAGKLDRRPLSLQPERGAGPESPFSFPGKVLADEASGRLFVSDSNRNRIVLISLADNSVVEIVGSGEIGMKDGGFREAAFNHPQGMALDGKILYIADTENHAIRAVDFEARKVTTIAGTGERGRERRFDISGPARTTPLSSPWDVVVNGRVLYIAMAGTHQIWRMDLKTNMLRPHAGTGREGRVDGPLALSDLAQPSGTTTDGKKLYFADSEVSAIRSADLADDGAVETIAGGDLFDFGDRDGIGREARFQHPLGVAYHEGALYVADAYNHKIKRVWLKDRSVETLFGSGEAGFQDGEQARFHEPGGVSIAGGKLYVADTNNHAVRVVDMNTRRVETLQVRMPRQETAVAAARLRRAQTVCPGEAALTIALELPAGYKLNPEAPSWVKVVSSDKQVLALGGAESLMFENPEFPIRLAAGAKAGEANLEVECALYYCKEEGGSCHFKEARLRLPVKVEKESENSRLRISCIIDSP